MSPPSLWRFTVMATGPLARRPIRKRTRRCYLERVRMPVRPAFRSFTTNEVNGPFWVHVAGFSATCAASRVVDRIGLALFYPVGEVAAVGLDSATKVCYHCGLCRPQCVCYEAELKSLNFRQKIAVVRRARPWQLLAQALNATQLPRPVWYAIASSNIGG
jgi:hypothetical protein